MGRMKSAFWCLAVCCVLPSCTSRDVGPVGAGNPPSASASAVNSGESGRTSTSRVDPALIVETVNSSAAMIIPVPTVAELAAQKDTHSVVMGRVVETVDFCSGGSGRRLLTIAVDSSYKAKVTGEVKVVEPGGIVPHECLREVLDGKFGEKFVPEPGVYVDFRIEGHPHTETGAEVVAFLSAERTYKNGATHSLVTGAQGLFVKRDGAFVRSILDSEIWRAEGVESRIPVDGAQTMLKRVAK